MPNIKKPQDKIKKIRSVSVSDYHLQLIKIKFSGLSEAIEYYAKKIEKKIKYHNSKKEKKNEDI